jgi:hypothetical protein
MGIAGAEENPADLLPKNQLPVESERKRNLLI